MNSPKRIAINLGGGYVPGLNAVLHGAVLAATELGWEILGLRDGYEGLLFPERYPYRGIVKLSPALMDSVAGAAGCLLGTAARTDPFHVRQVNAQHAVEEMDRSEEVITWTKREKIEAVISIVDVQALSILWKLHRKGLPTVCVPRSAENQMAATQLAFGFNSALSFTVEMLDHARQAAASARKIGVVEVPGEHAGWLALQAGIAVCADAVLIPEIPYDLAKVAARLNQRLLDGQTHGLVVVSEGAITAAGHIQPTAAHPLKASLSPGATGDVGGHVITHTGHAAEMVATTLQRLVRHETYPLALGPLAKGGSITAVDRQLGIGYGAAAVRAIQQNQTGTMVSLQPPELKFVPLADAINKFRTVPSDSVFMQVARSLGVALGD
jgi:ATP-dependent phosphofructokinase / diphosphate-dependent phosphofructokinase